MEASQLAVSASSQLAVSAPSQLAVSAPSQLTVLAPLKPASPIPLKPAASTAVTLKPASTPVALKPASTLKPASKPVHVKPAELASSPVPVKKALVPVPSKPSLLRGVVTSFVKKTTNFCFIDCNRSNLPDSLQSFHRPEVGIYSFQSGWQQRLYRGAEVLFCVRTSDSGELHAYDVQITCSERVFRNRCAEDDAYLHGKSSHDDFGCNW